MQLKVLHVTRYRYQPDAWDSFNELRLRPADDYRQTLHAFELTVRPRAEIRSHRDEHDTLVHHFHLPAHHGMLVIAASSWVETYPVPAPIETGAERLLGLRQRFFEFLAPTDRVPLQHDWHESIAAARLEPSFGVAMHVDALNQAVHRRFRYQPNLTGVDTPLIDFVAAGAGVCQDYAHALLALLRADGIPARYVSGYVHANPDQESSLLGSEGSHAWVEAFLPGNGWVGLDPTNGCRIGEAHIKIGVGRDYDDVPPVRGWRRGGGEGALEVEVSVRHGEPPQPYPGALEWSSADEH